MRQNTTPSNAPCRHAEPKHRRTTDTDRHRSCRGYSESASVPSASPTGRREASVMVQTAGCNFGLRAPARYENQGKLALSALESHMNTLHPPGRQGPYPQQQMIQTDEVPGLPNWPRRLDPATGKDVGAHLLKGTNSDDTGNRL